MKSSRAASLILAALVVASLSGKALTRQPPEPDTRLFTQAVDQGLRTRGFEVTRRTLLSGVYLYGERGDCRLMVTEQDAFGTLADRNAQFAREIGPLHYVWRGRRYEAAPRVAILTRFLVRREMVRIGLSPPRQPLGVVAGGPGCSLPDMAGLIPVDLPR